MRRLVYNDDTDYDEYLGDVKRIIQICADRGFQIDEFSARSAWQKYSDLMCAGWMHLDDDDDSVFANIQNYLVEVK